MTKLTRRTFVCLAIALSSLFPGRAFAQSGRANINDTRKPRPETRPVLRKDNETPEVSEVSPELQYHLEQWEAATKDIKKLTGHHWRYVYNKVFEVEKRAVGKFYYEAPDKGRMDIAAADIDKNDTPGRSGPNGPYDLQADLPERWVCDGKYILQVNDADKTYEVFPLPKDLQGRNIMDGPLPFVFGMPAELAKQRYRLRMLPPPKNFEKTHIRLEAKPRWPQDARNYQLADVLLSKKNYLPTAVKLVDPSGSVETVYTFDISEPNKVVQSLLNFVGGSNPFRPNLRGYKRIQSPNLANAEPPQDKEVTVPKLTGLSYEQAAQRLGGLGLKLQHTNKLPADISEFIVEVIEQKTKADEIVPRGTTIVVSLKLIPSADVPTLLGLRYDQAQEKLKDLGLKVELKKGKQTTNKDLIFRVQQQSPSAGDKVPKGTTIVLTLYDKVRS